MEIGQSITVEVFEEGLVKWLKKKGIRVRALAGYHNISESEITIKYPTNDPILIVSIKPTIMVPIRIIKNLFFSFLFKILLKFVRRFFI